MATDERGKRRKGNDRQATTSKKQWEKAVVRTASGDFTMRCTLSMIAGGAAVTIAAMSGKKQS